MLQVKQLTKSFGVEIVLDNLTFMLNDGERVGLVGPNGSGKTTLLRCIAGLEFPDSGEVIRSPSDLTIGYLAQAATEIDGQTVADAIAGAQVEWRDAEAAVGDAASALAADPENVELLSWYDEALAQFEAFGGYEREQRALAILDGLGLDESRLPQTVESLSGGQKTRLGLAMLLLREPDVLLLDEPTNHLDIEALVWLEGLIRSFHGAVLIVSHDREFLDRTVERILFLDPHERTVRSYEGNYAAFTAARQAEAEIQRATWVQQEKYAHKVAADVARLKGEALDIELSTTPRQPGVRRLARKKVGLAKSREKKLNRFLESDERVEKPRQDWSLKLDFGDARPSGRSVLRLDSVSFGYPGQPFLFQGVDLDLRAGERLAITGPNGSGKTTLIQLIMGSLEPTGGSIRLGAGVRLGLMAQEQETLDLELTVLDTALRERPMSQTDARNFLHYFLFSGDEVYRLVGKCSLGERARLQLALLMLRGCNLLVLDEPLNHLDIEGREQFQRALTEFDGTVVAVVHDRAFLRGFDAPIFWLQDGEARVFADYELFAERVMRT